MSPARIKNAPALLSLPEHEAAARAFAEAKAATDDYRRGAESERALYRSRVDGILGEVYVSRILNLPLPDLSMHEGDHGADVGPWQIKATDCSRYTPARRSFMFYPSALRNEGNILGLGYRATPAGRLYRLRYAFTYEDARTFASDPFTAGARLRGARAVYEADLTAAASPVEFDVWSRRVTE